MTMQEERLAYEYPPSDITLRRNSSPDNNGASNVEPHCSMYPIDGVIELSLG